jgi:hypothetical protein
MPQSIIDHKLDLLAVLGLNVEGCETRDQLAQRVLDWLKENPERMEVFKYNAAYAQAGCFRDYRFKDFMDLAREGLKGINDWDDTDILEHLDCLWDCFGGHEDFIKYLSVKDE